MAPAERSLYIINCPTEPNTGNCIISTGSDYKVTATALWYNFNRGQMGKGSVDFGKVLFINASCTFSVKVTVNNCTLMVIRLPTQWQYTNKSHIEIASNTDGTNVCSVPFLSSFTRFGLFGKSKSKMFFPSLAWSKHWFKTFMWARRFTLQTIQLKGLLSHFPNIYLQMRIPFYLKKRML